jgi:hypothetical protein
MGIFKISLTQGVVNKETRRGRFQLPFGEIRSETIKSRLEDLLRGRRVGVKKWTVGIHEEFQTDSVTLHPNDTQYCP